MIIYLQDPHSFNYLLCDNLFHYLCVTYTHAISIKTIIIFDSFLIFIVAVYKFGSFLYSVMVK